MRLYCLERFYLTLFICHFISIMRSTSKFHLSMKFISKSCWILFFSPLLLFSSAEGICFCTLSCPFSGICPDTRQSIPVTDSGPAIKVLRCVFAAAVCQCFGSWCMYTVHSCLLFHINSSRCFQRERQSAEFKGALILLHEGAFEISL